MRVYTIMALQQLECVDLDKPLKLPRDVLGVLAVYRTKKAAHAARAKLFGKNAKNYLISSFERTRGTEAESETNQQV